MDARGDGGVGDVGSLLRCDAVLATFAPDGPDSCSGLPVRRYDADGLLAEVGPGFRLVEAWREEHRTPWDAVQSFQYVLLRRT